MKRIIYTTILLAVFLACTVYGSEFKLSTVSEDNRQAVLVNATTGETHYVQIGDEIEGWKVTAIKKESINVFQAGDQGIVYMKSIPLTGKLAQQVKAKIPK